MLTRIVKLFSQNFIMTEQRSHFLVAACIMCTKHMELTAARVEAC